ncbi:hypothetical protein EUGRSUZ_G00350 [Eucalyptus grandis]|uniref:Uncharacterized protein n=2 Tax=Eucalyptus grandis TaxID=71139 RepID=A0ACC3JZZ0_EUCGR|nr:hypothetical protein EUGRSUZ_G00350 [Eucalyptus grandis]
MYGGNLTPKMSAVAFSNFTSKFIKKKKKNKCEFHGIHSIDHIQGKIEGKIYPTENSMILYQINEQNLFSICRITKSIRSL